MPGRFIEISRENTHLRVDRGFMQVVDKSASSSVVGQVPLDDIDALIVSAHGASYSNNLLVELAQRGAPFVLCAQNFLPVGVLMSLDGNHQQAGRIDAQISASKPTYKRLWRTIVKAKIEQQAATLRSLNKTDMPVRSLASKVKSGDPENFEAQAARRYWNILLGNDFRRNRNAGGTNAMLNYGYTVLRSATARATIAAGLHPSIGLHHSNKSNAMRLVDDLIEPFRPIIDYRVARLTNEDNIELTAEVKKELVHCLYTDLRSSDGHTPLTVCMQRLATSLVHVLMGEAKELELPAPWFTAQPQDGLF